MIGDLHVIPDDGREHSVNEDCVCTPRATSSKHANGQLWIHSHKDNMDAAVWPLRQMLRETDEREE